jgi:hypothetical protein
LAAKNLTHSSATVQVNDHPWQLLETQEEDDEVLYIPGSRLRNRKVDRVDSLASPPDLAQKPDDLANSRQ